jgi:hypothetical protein
MHHFGEAEDQEETVFHLEACQGTKHRVTRFVQRVKVFDVISTGDHGAVSVWDMVEMWVLIEMALVVHAVRFLEVKL